MNLTIEQLPFYVVPVSTASTIASIAEQRSTQYRNHYGDFSLSLKNPEPEDFHPDALLIAAISKDNSNILGSFRLEKNILADEKINLIEKHAKLKISGNSAFVSRLVVMKTDEQLRVRNALFKFLHRYCFSNQIENIIVAAKPPLDKIYQRLGFKPALELDQLIPSEWSGNHITRVLYLNTVDVVVDWRINNHGLYGFMANTYHPDLKIHS